MSGRQGDESREDRERLSPTELRSLFLFESLNDAQLELLAECGRVEQRAAGSVVFAEGEPATCFFVLLEGSVALSRRVRGDDVEVLRADHRGVYGGANQAYLGDRVEQRYINTMRALTGSCFFVLPADEFGTAVRTWFPMAVHLLEGLFHGLRLSNTVTGERERLVALGALSAGLTHELNNPAAAALRATSALGERIVGMRKEFAAIADGSLDGPRLKGLVELQEAAVQRATTARQLSALDASDAEDELSDWLDEHRIEGSWDLASTLVAGGVDTAWLDSVARAVGEEQLAPAVRWIIHSIDTELLRVEIDDSVSRISGLVDAAKQYSQLDRAPQQTVDIHTLLEATLTMLRAKIAPGVTVVRQYDPDLPPILAYGAELNQVWTNLIVNALYAMGGEGTLTLRTRRDGDRLLAEVGDTGPGIPPEVRPRIFEPFYTTKPVGEGTGLGLDISYRIVVNKHHGDIRVDSRPGETWFRVGLPLARDTPT
ncbi:ATP-binding protein [Streptomyces arenae]|uniref:ATP-binding protein n=1 Tax=Streptomyces arenae TaxID=29301 RepID=UPI00265944AF|nr:ATP-binding protein [Streptomyces arenae]MCG7210104.1 ATP-binding protein [Streptomyces arenae]